MSFLLLFSGSSIKALEKTLKLWNIPTPNEFYIKRTGLLKKVETELIGKGEQKGIAIIGMAGMGKTQLAKEYALTHGGKYDLIWWFDANQDLLPQLRQLGQKLHALKKCPMPDDNQVNQMKWLEAIQYCSLEYFPKAIFIIDDVKDDEQIKLINETFKTISLLLTSRNQSIKGPHVMLKSFSRNESLEYLKKVLPSNTDTALNELAKTLNDYPLAITQAISYIKAHPSLVIEEYISLYKEKRKALWQEEEKLTAGQSNEAALLEDYRRTVGATFTLLLDELQKTSPHALKLLKLTSFLGSQDIPKRFLKIWIVDHQKGTDFDFHNATSALLKSSIFEKNESSENQEETYNVHAVLHEYVRSTLPKEEKDFYLKKAVKLLSSLLPESSYKVWKVLFDDRHLEFHLETLLDMAERYNFQSTELLILKIKHLHNLWYSKSDSDLSTKKSILLEKEVSSNNNLPAFEKARFLVITSNITSVKEGCKKAILICEEAEKLLEGLSSQEAKEELFFLLVNNLMEFYTVIGDFEKGEEAAKKAKVLLPKINHPTYLILYYFMKSFQLLTKGIYKAALTHVDIAISKFPSTDFPDHFHIFNKIIKSEILARAGELDRALELAKQSYDEFKKYYPNDSNYKLYKTEMILAFIYLKQGDLREAKRLVKSAIKGLNFIFNKSDEDLSQGFSHTILGEIYEKEGNLSYALEAYKKAEEIYSHILKTIEVDDISYLYKNYVMLGEKMKDEFTIKKYLQLLIDNFGLDHVRTKEAIQYLDEHNILVFS